MIGVSALPTVGQSDQFKQSFREEAREVAVDLESALLELNSNSRDPELIGRVFRALHTIKGSGSMFGFEELAAFTHNLETAYDEVRNGRLQVSSELIDLTLAALDQIRAMLDEGAGVPPDNAESRAGILARLRQLVNLPESEAVERKPASVAPAAQAPGGAVREWHL